MAVVVALVLAAALPSRAQTSEGDQSQTEVIRGTVVNAATQAPIPRALVYSGDNRYAVLTDGDGHFEFTVSKQGSNAGVGYTYMGPSGGTRAVSGAFNGVPLMAKKPGFLDPPDGMAQTSSENDVTISLLPEAIIKGRVSAAGVDAAAGVPVQMFSHEVQQGVARWIPARSVTTNSAGEFRFAELLPGSYKIVTQEWMDNDPAASLPGSQLYGYPPVYFPGVGDSSEAGTIELSAGQTVQADLPIVRQPYYQVRIPVANAQFTNGLGVSVQGERGSHYELGYNQGEQRIEGMLPSGSYVVAATSYGMNSESGSVSIRVADAPLQGPSLTLTPNTSIRVNVKEEFTGTRENSAFGGEFNGIPLRGPRLYLQVNVEGAEDFEQRGAGLRPPTSPTDEAMVIDGLSPGRYWVRLSSARGYVASATMGSTDVLREPLVVGSGASAPIDVTLRDDGAELEGTMNSLADQNASSGSTPNRAWIYIVPLPESTGQFQETGMSEDGKFTVQMMTPGDYRVFAFNRPQSHLPYRDAEAMKAYESKGQVVHLSAGQKTTVQVQIISAD